jgi:hypothetical protein
MWPYNRMGNLFSMSPPISDPENVLNYILRGIFNKIDIVDMIALSDPEKCPNYIIFGAKALEDLFLKMNLRATTGPDGIVYFRKISTYQQGFTGDLQREHQQNCREISKFFSEIFRIFGGLALSIINMNTPIHKLIENRKARGVSGTEFAKTGDVFAGVSGRMSGGANLNIKLDPTQPIGRILSNENYFVNSGDNRIRLKMDRSSEDGEVWINVDDIEYEDVAGAAIKRIVQPVLVNYSFRANNVEGRITCEMVVEENPVRLVLRKFAWLGKPIPGSNDPTKLPPKISNIEVRGPHFGCNIEGRAHSFRACLLSHFIKTQEEIAPEIVTTASYLENWGYIYKNQYPSGFTQLRGTRNLYLDESTRTTQTALVLYQPELKLSETKTKTIKLLCVVNIKKIPAAGEIRYSVEVSRVILKESSRDIQERFVALDQTKSTTKFTAPTESSSPTTPDGLSVTDFIVRIAKSTLNPNYRLGSGSAGYKEDKRHGMILLPKTSDGDDDLRKLQKILIDESTMPSCSAYARLLLDNFKTNPTSHVCNRTFRQQLGVPEDNQSVKTSAGVYQLWFLVSGAVDDSGAKHIATNPTWTEFKNRMKELEIYSGEMSESPACKTDGDISVSRPLATKLRDTIRQLLRKQEDHLRSAFEIIWLLFDRNLALKREGFKINAALYRGGSRRLEEIRLMCVKLLAEYYVGCQDIYNGAVREILDSTSEVTEKTGQPYRDTINANNTNNKDNINNENDYIRV